MCFAACAFLVPVQLISTNHSAIGDLHLLCTWAALPYGVASIRRIRTPSRRYRPKKIHAPQTPCIHVSADLNTSCHLLCILRNYSPSNQKQKNRCRNHHIVVFYIECGL